MVSKDKMIEMLCQRELEWVVHDCEYSRYTEVLKHGFKGYNRFTLAQLVQQAVAFGLWEGVCKKTTRG